MWFIQTSYDTLPVEVIVDRYVYTISRILSYLFVLLDDERRHHTFVAEAFFVLAHDSARPVFCWREPGFRFLIRHRRASRPNEQSVVRLTLCRRAQRSSQSQRFEACFSWPSCSPSAPLRCASFSSSVFATVLRLRWMNVKTCMSCKASNQQRYHVATRQSPSRMVRSTGLIYST